MKMKKNRFLAIIVLAIIVSLLSACGSSSELSETDTIPEAESSPLPEETSEPVVAEPADGYRELGGLWEVGAVFYRNQIIDIHDVPGLADLYDTTYLSFNEDGSFLYINLFFTSGTYSRIKDNTFLLKTDRVYRLDYQDGEVVEVDSTSSSNPSFIVTITADDENTLVFNAYDPITGKARANDDPLYFAKSGQDGLFIDGHKVDVSGSTGNSNHSETNNRAAGSPKNSPGVTDHVATSGEKNALSKAKSYLSFSAFSYSGLIEQLEYEGYTASEARYGADNCGADWYEQADRKAKSYLEHSAFSYSGLVEQLKYEGFTDAQAKYGVDHCGADWNEQAAKKAKEYLNYSSFSRSELIEQLEYEGFTHAQAEYGVDTVY